MSTNEEKLKAAEEHLAMGQELLAMAESVGHK